MYVNIMNLKLPFQILLIHWLFVEFRGFLIVKKTCSYQVHHSGPYACLLIGFIQVDGGCVFIGFAAGDLCLCLLPQSSFFGGYKIFIFLLRSVFYNVAKIIILWYPSANFLRKH
jgi:hypothetical protein